MEEFYGILGDESNSEKFCILAKEREQGINECVFDENENRWRDVLVNAPIHTWSSEVASVSDYLPLWALLPVKSSNEDIVESFKNSGLIRLFGISTTNVGSEQQWDGPNAWTSARNDDLGN